MTRIALETDLSNAHAIEELPPQKSPLPTALMGLAVLAAAALAMLTLSAPQQSATATRVAPRESTGRAHLAAPPPVTMPTTLTMPLAGLGRNRLATDRGWVPGGAARHGHGYGLPPVRPLGQGR